MSGFCLESISRARRRHRSRGGGGQAGWWLVLALGSWSLAAGDWDSREAGRARQLYVAKCAKCHAFYEPTRYADAEWRGWMEKMGRKSKLKPGQQALLERYLDAYRAGKLPGKPEAPPPRSR